VPGVVPPQVQDPAPALAPQPFQLTLRWEATAAGAKRTDS